MMKLLSAACSKTPLFDRTLISNQPTARAIDESGRRSTLVEQPTNFEMVVM